MLPFWPLDDIPSVYLPSRVLGLCFSVLQCPLMTDFTPIMDNTTRSSSSSTEPELEWARWKSHQLYKSTTKLKLEAIVQRTKIPITPALQKHQLLFICDHYKEPCQIPYFLYTLEKIPPTTSGIKQLTIPKLKSIFPFSNLPPYGPKYVEGCFATTWKKLQQ